ncbi:MAG TPA: RNA methyltransferase [Spirochaetota bacterium]
MISDPKRIRVVIIEPTAPGNIGSIARAMANFSLSRLILVRPREIDYGMAKEFACNGGDVIDTIEIVDTLEAAISGVSCVVGTTRRARDNESTLPARRAGKIIAENPGECALLFGRERSGLSKEEKFRCTFLSHIDTVDGAAGSLNISHAASLFFYEIYSAEKSMETTCVDVSPLVRSFDQILSEEESFGQIDYIRKTFQSMVLRSGLTSSEIKKMALFFGYCAAKMRERL